MALDYELHLSGRNVDDLFDDEDYGFPFSEDAEEIDRILAEELPPKRRRKKKKSPKR